VKPEPLLSEKKIEQLRDRAIDITGAHEYSETAFAHLVAAAAITRLAKDHAHNPVLQRAARLRVNEHRYRARAEREVAKQIREAHSDV
jgi:hypothetical protein